MMDTRALSKKLNATWSAWSLDSSYVDGELVTSVADDFGKFTQNVQLRLVVGLLMDVKKRAAFTPSMKRLLNAAVAAADAAGGEAGAWVRVVAGVVHRRLFQTNDRDIEAAAVKALDEAVEATVALMEADSEAEAPSSSSSSLTHYKSVMSKFQLGRDAEGESDSHTVANPYFTYAGKRPMFLGRKDERAKEPKQETARASLTQSVNLKRGPSFASSSSGTAAAGGGDANGMRPAHMAASVRPMLKERVQSTKMARMDDSVVQRLMGKEKQEKLEKLEKARLAKLAKEERIRVRDDAAKKKQDAKEAADREKKQEAATTARGDGGAAAGAGAGTHPGTPPGTPPYSPPGTPPYSPPGSPLVGPGTPPSPP